MGGLQELLGATAQQNAIRRLEVQMAQAAYRAYRRIQFAGQTALRDTREGFDPRWNEYTRKEYNARAQVGREIQYIDGDFRIEVKAGYDADTDQDTTDILVLDRKSRVGAGLHIIIDEEGYEIYRQWERNRRDRR